MKLRFTIEADVDEAKAMVDDGLGDPGSWTVADFIDAYTEGVIGEDVGMVGVEEV